MLHTKQFCTKFSAPKCAHQTVDTKMLVPTKQNQLNYTKYSLLKLIICTHFSWLPIARSRFSRRFDRTTALLGRATSSAVSWCDASCSWNSCWSLPLPPIGPAAVLAACGSCCSSALWLPPPSSEAAFGWLAASRLVANMSVIRNELWFLRSIIVVSDWFVSIAQLQWTTYLFRPRNGKCQYI